MQDLANQAAVYQGVLNSVKQRTSIAPGAWYPHDTLGALYQLAELLKGDDRDIVRLLSQGPVLDLCCGDGDLAFFLASQGFSVDAVDWPRTNYNHMAGVRAMRQALNSTVHIEEADLDGAFNLPRPFYNVVFFMGALYHLKNPLTVLERIAASCGYCILTTRVTRYAADRSTDIGSLPVAYLVDSSETNDDTTNYWIFTQAGLRRALTRCRWRISAMMTRGAADSDPASHQGDQRAWCFLRSAYRRIEFLEGVHPLEFEAWRWTEQRFCLRVWHEPTGPAAFTLPLYLPDSVLDALGPVTVLATANGSILPPLVLLEPGCHDLTIPVSRLNHDSTLIEVQIDKALPPDESDKRERSIVIRTLSEPRP